MTKNIDHISKKEFMEKLESYRKGSVTRRHFLNVTGLGARVMVFLNAAQRAGRLLYCSNVKASTTPPDGARSPKLKMKTTVSGMISITRNQAPAGASSNQLRVRWVMLFSPRSRLGRLKTGHQLGTVRISQGHGGAEFQRT